MTPDKVKYCNDILTFLLEHEEKVNLTGPDTQTAFKNKYSNDLRSTLSLVSQFLYERYDLIKYSGGLNNYISLTPEGEEAAEKGIVQYLDDLKNSKRLREMANHATIKSLRFSKIALIISIVSIIITLLALIF